MSVARRHRSGATRTVLCRLSRSAEPGEQALQFVGALETDRQAAAAGIVLLQAHRQADLLGDLLLERRRTRLDRTRLGAAVAPSKLSMWSTQLLLLLLLFKSRL